MFKALNSDKPTQQKNPHGFKTATETRSLPTQIPVNIQDHIELSQQEASHLTDAQRTAIRGYTGFAAAVCNTALLGKEVNYMEAPAWRDIYSPMDFNNKEELIDYMETLDEALSVRKQESRILYRGTPIYTSLHDEIGASIGKNLTVKDTEGLIAGLKEYFKPGKVFNNANYLSTSTSAYIAAERTPNTADTKQTYYEQAEISGIVYELKTNAGLDVTGLAKAFRARERETILPRDTHFKVVNVITKPEEYRTVSGYDNRYKPEKMHAKNFQKLAVIVQMVEVDAEGNEITHTNPHKPETVLEKIIKN